MFFRIYVSICGGNRVSYVLKNIVVKNTVSHIDNILWIVMFSDPIYSLYCAYEVQRKLHIVNYSFFCYFKSFSISCFKAYLYICAYERQRIIIIWPKYLHSLSFGSIIEVSARHNSVNIYKK